MTDYTVISKVTSELVNRLREGLCPNIISSVDLIGATNDTSSLKYILNICLYNIVKADIALADNINTNFTPLRLEYMITAQSKGEPSTYSLEEQVILGKVVSIFNDAPVIYGLDSNGLSISIEMNKLSLYDKNSLNSKKPGLFYYVEPILIKTRKAAKAPRVIHVGGEK